MVGCKNDIGIQQCSIKRFWQNILNCDWMYIFSVIIKVMMNIGRIVYTNPGKRFVMHFTYWLKSKL